MYQESQKPLFAWHFFFIVSLSILCKESEKLVLLSVNEEGNRRN